MASLAAVTTFARKGLTSAVGRNALSLYLLQFGNYAIPLATVPYLVRVLGPEKFGLVAFGQGLMAYFSLVVNYGFDWSATRKIAVNHDDQAALSQTVSDVWAAKALLCAATALILFVLVLSVPKLSEVSRLLLILYGCVVGNMLFPTWLFQGMERMGVISATNLGVRVVGAITIFTFVHHPGDFVLYALVLSAQWLTAGLMGVAAAFRLFHLRLALPSWYGVQREIADSAAFFFTTAAISLYTSGNAFVLGLLANPAAVGYYSAAERIVIAVAGLVQPLSQAVYPRFSRLARDSKTQALLWARRMLVLTGGGGLLLSILLCAGAPLIVHVVLGPKYAPSAEVMAIMSPLPVLIAISNVFGVQLLVPFGYENNLLAIVVTAGFINITLAVLLAPHWLGPGMAGAVLISETFVTLGSFTRAWSLKINPLSAL